MGEGSDKGGSEGRGKGVGNRKANEWSL